MKQVKIFSKSSLSDLERALNGYLNTLDHSNILRNITYNPPTEKVKFWTAVVEVDLYGGKPVFWAANKKELEEAVKMYGDKAEAPFVVRIPDGVSEIEDSAFEEDDSVGVILIPDTVTKIGRGAFEKCSNLQDVVIPESVNEIEGYAFLECPKIRNVYIPKSVTKIGGYSITTSAKTIKVDPENPVYDSRNDCNAIIETKTNTLINGCCGTIIPDSVTKIAESAFHFCSQLPYNFKIPDSVREIGRNAFDCCNLGSLRIPNSISRIETEVFNASTLSTIYIPNSVTYIDSFAFCNCYTLTDVHIEINDPNSVTFGDNDDCFDDIKGDDNRQRRLWVPKGTKSLYENHPAFKVFDIIMEEK